MIQHAMHNKTVKRVDDYVSKL